MKTRLYITLQMQNGKHISFETTQVHCLSHYAGHSIILYELRTKLLVWGKCQHITLSAAHVCFVHFRVMRSILSRKDNILLMEELLHQLIDMLSGYLQGFIHPSAQVGQDFFPQQYHQVLLSHDLLSKHPFFWQLAPLTAR